MKIVSGSTAEAHSPEVEEKQYVALPTCLYFHRSKAQIRCIVGPVGSGKTSAATIEMCYNIPKYLFDQHGYKHTRWVVLRNTYPQLHDSTRRTVQEWFPWGKYTATNKTLTLDYPEGFKVEIMFRSCDRPDDIDKFKSLELTGYWIDESTEVADEIKRMLKNRIGRWPQKSKVRFGIETTNPPDVTATTYWQFAWITAPSGHPGPIIPPGPMVKKDPLKNHEGFWQPPQENIANLRPGYYDDLRSDYADNQDWVDLYIEGRPGILVTGKLVYHNFRRDVHVSRKPLEWSGGKLYVGWDHSGNTPAAVVVQVPTAGSAQILHEFYSDKMGIVDFGHYVIEECNRMFPGNEMEHWGDPAGSQQFSKRTGGFTSNTILLEQEVGISVTASEQNFRARVESVEQRMARIDGLLIDPSCIMLINGFIGGYHYPPNMSVMGEYLPNVRKNKYSHPHDALQYVMVKLFKPNLRKDLVPGYREHKDEEEANYDPREVW